MVDGRLLTFSALGLLVAAVRIRGSAAALKYAEVQVPLSTGYKAQATWVPQTERVRVTIGRARLEGRLIEGRLYIDTPGFGKLMTWDDLLAIEGALFDAPLKQE